MLPFRVLYLGPLLSEAPRWVKDNIPFCGEAYLAHVRYGTDSENSLDRPDLKSRSFFRFLENQGVPSFGVLIIRILRFKVLYGVPYFGNPPPHFSQRILGSPTTQALSKKWGAFCVTEVSGTFRGLPDRASGDSKPICL